MNTWPKKGVCFAAGLKTLAPSKHRVIHLVFIFAASAGHEVGSKGIPDRHRPRRVHFQRMGPIIRLERPAERRESLRHPVRFVVFIAAARPGAGRLFGGDHAPPASGPSHKR